MNESNLPPGLNEDFNAGPERLKVCLVCGGTGSLEDYKMEFSCCGMPHPDGSCCGIEAQIPVKIWVKCYGCNGFGDIPMTPEEILDEIEEKKENQAEL